MTELSGTEKKEKFVQSILSLLNSLMFSGG